MSARVRLEPKATVKPPDNSADESKETARRHDRNRDERMRIFIRRGPSGDYWHSHRGWIATRELATAYTGVVDALDSCIENCLTKADIVLVFGTGHAEVRLSHKLAS